MQELADCLNIKIALAHNYQEYLEFTRDSFWEKNNKKKTKEKKRKRKRKKKKEKKRKIK